MVKPSSSAFQIECQSAESSDLKPATSEYAFVRLVISGCSIGSLEQVAYIPSVRNGLSRLLQAPQASSHALAIVTSDHWKTWMFSDEVEGNYIVSLGETFDDFLILACRVESRLVLMWSLFEEPMFSYENQVPGFPHKAEIELQEVETAIQLFLRQH